ncbi:hypothetical protein GO013_14745 [Pseudodesulfovibrio sp. JC047]|uniref:hypothetical protein n=1 Tax=Pseudodesulfovibrio sp. JC047 TaxID=2683199 RepID=UPI0013D6FE8E|nr:hypothetical protein [Pseudodesulfovibrio sp. JC047]NDV20667.1 hypothetical protein [Pseudodesulfovibrio sp. JC047]
MSSLHPQMKKYRRRNFLRRCKGETFGIMLKDSSPPSAQTSINKEKLGLFLSSSLHLSIPKKKGMFRRTEIRRNMTFFCSKTAIKLG